MGCENLAVLHQVIPWASDDFTDAQRMLSWQCIVKFRRNILVSDHLPPWMHMKSEFVIGPVETEI